MRRKPGSTIRSELKVKHRRIAAPTLSALAAGIVNSGWDLIPMPGGYRFEHRLDHRRTGQWPTPDGAAREVERLRRAAASIGDYLSQDTSPWANVPPHLRSSVRAYINSEQDKDRERALRLCEHYELDYAVMRKVILEEMIEESRALGKSWTPAAGSRPLSPERPGGEGTDAVQRDNA